MFQDTMKTILPPHPHTEEATVFRSQDGRYHALVVIGFAVPSRVAAMLPEDASGYHFIPAAGIGDHENLKSRARHWTRPILLDKGDTLQPGVANLNHATAEGCDTQIKIAITPAQWHLVGMLCGRLRITPAQWFIAGAFHNAAIEERDIERRLATVTP